MNIQLNKEQLSTYYYLPSEICYEPNCLYNLYPAV